MQQVVGVERGVDVVDIEHTSEIIVKLLEDGIADFSWYWRNYNYDVNFINKYDA